MAVEAIWSQESYLMQGGADGAAYTQVIPIKTYPDLGGEPEQIQTTDLSQVKNHTYINGLQDTGAFQFTANYTTANWAAAKTAMDAGEQWYAVYFGSGRDETIDNTNGAFYFLGTMTAWPTGHGVNEAREMTVSISVASEVYDEDPNA